jgi:hypothetical protein
MRIGSPLIALSAILVLPQLIAETPNTLAFSSGVILFIVGVFRREEESARA